MANRYPKSPRSEAKAKATAKAMWEAGDPPTRIGKAVNRHPSWVYNLSVREKWGRRGGEYVAPIVTRICYNCLGRYQAADNDFTPHDCEAARAAALAERIAA